MAKESFYTAIDLGTSKVCTLIARVGADGELQVLGLGVVPSQGVEKGLVVNIREAKEAVAASVDEARRYLGRGISWAYVGVSGAHVDSISSTGVLSSQKEEGFVSTEAVASLVRSATPKVEDGKEVLHVIPRDFSVDGLHGVRNPVGLQARQLEVETNIVMADDDKLRNVRRAVEKAGLDVRGLVLAPLAAGYAVLTEDEREMGVVLVDIGCGTSDIGIFRGGALWNSACVPVGGFQVTRDLSIALGIPYYYAEEAKLRWGHAVPSQVDESEEVLIPSFQGAARHTVKRRQVCLPIAERMTETLRLVMAKVYQSGLQRLPAGGVVLTGGAISLTGMEDLARQVIPGAVRIGQPKGLAGLPPELRKPAFATSVGILLWGIQGHDKQKSVATSSSASVGGTRWNPINMFKRVGEVASVGSIKGTATSLAAKVKRIYA